MDRIFNRAFHFDSQTQTAGTAIQILVPPVESRIARITNLIYDCGSTAHTITVMKALERTYLTAAVSASGTVLNVANATFLATAIAGSDYVVYKQTDGTYDFRLVSSLSTLAITVGSGVTLALDDASPVWLFGAVGESDNQTIATKASTLHYFSDPIAGIAQSGFAGRTISSTYYNGRSGYGDPLIVSSNNATAAGTIQNLSGYYART